MADEPEPSEAELRQRRARVIFEDRLRARARHYLTPWCGAASYQELEDAMTQFAMELTGQTPKRRLASGGSSVA